MPEDARSALECGGLTPPCFRGWRLRPDVLCRDVGDIGPYHSTSSIAISAVSR